MTHSEIKLQDVLKIKPPHEILLWNVFIKSTEKTLFLSVNEFVKKQKQNNIYKCKYAEDHLTVLEIKDCQPFINNANDLFYIKDDKFIYLDKKQNINFC